MTYSVVAHDPESGAFGVAVQSHYFSVGAVVPWVEAGVGAVATQAFGEITYGSLGLVRMRAGDSAGAALNSLVAADAGDATRQVAMVDRDGTVAVHTGANCIDFAGHRTGSGWSVQANMMRNPGVPEAMAEAYSATNGDLIDRLLAALDAAEAAGGDVRGQQAAALLVSSTADDGSVSAESVLRLHVEDHDRPLVELRRLADMHRAYQLVGQTFERAQAGDLDGMVPGLERALELAPASTDIQFRLAATRTLFGDPRGREMLDALFVDNPSWRDLIPRLAAVGELPNRPGVVDLLLGNPQ